MGTKTHEIVESHPIYEVYEVYEENVKCKVNEKRNENNHKMIIVFDADLYIDDDHIVWDLCIRFIWSRFCFHFSFIK